MPRCDSPPAGRNGVGGASRLAQSTDNRGPRSQAMTPRFLHLWMSAAAIALFAGSALACPPGQKRGSSAASVSSTSDQVSSDRVLSKPSKFRSMVLEQFDATNNGRLDSKERAAANRALSAKGGGPAIEALRKQAIAEFDTNHNGKLEKTEIHKALNTVNAGGNAKVAAKDSSKRSLSSEGQTAANELKQQMTINGITTTSGQIQTLENLLTNGSTLTPAETALIQSLLTQLLSQTASTSTTIPATLTAGTGTTSTGTNSSGTGSTMCSGGSQGSSSGSGSSGTGTGSSGTSTASTARSSNNQNANGNLLTGGGPGGGGNGFGGFAGGFRGFRGR